MIKFTSIRARLTLWGMIVQAIVLAMMGLTLWYTVKISLFSSVDRELSGKTRAFAAEWSRTYHERMKLPPPPTPQIKFRSLTRYRPRMIDLQGKGMDLEKNDVPWNPNGFETARSGKDAFNDIEVDGESLRVFSTPLKVDGRPIGVLQSVASLQEVEHDLTTLWRVLLTLIPLALLIIGVSGAFLADRLLHPIQKITQAASRIGAADLSERLSVQGEDELSRLAQTFNGMLGRLERAFEQQRRFTADASHELRTPLTVVKAHTSLALSGEKTSSEYRRALEGADRAATAMTQIVQDLLLLARLDTTKPETTGQASPIGEVLNAAVEMLSGIEHAPIRLEIDDADMLVCGEMNHVVRLFTNLLENAAHHTPLEKSIRVIARNEGASLTVKVVDTGTGIAPEHLPHVCERFYRVDSARSRKHGGTGLGLAISKSIVETYRGKLEIESVLGEGTVVSVSLPVAPSNEKVSALPASLAAR